MEVWKYGSKEKNQNKKYTVKLFVKLNFLQEVF
jgi:hypothetical protein